MTTTFAIHGGQIELASHRIHIIPSLLQQSLGAQPHTIAYAAPVVRTTPTAYLGGKIEISGEILQFPPTSITLFEQCVAALDARFHGTPIAAVPGLHCVGIDVETANEQWGSICQIGVSRIRDGEVVAQQSWLCQPPIPGFDEFNKNFHGITEATVADAPTFVEVLTEVQAWVGNDTVVAHNAQFDMTAFRDACVAANIPTPRWRFACSLAASRAAKLPVSSHRLNNMAEFLDVPLEHHHHAQDDANASALILVKLAQRIHAVGNIEQVFHALGFSLGTLSDASVFPVTALPPSHTATQAFQQNLTPTTSTAAVLSNAAPADITTTAGATTTQTQPQRRFRKWSNEPTQLPSPNEQADPTNALFGKVVVMTGDFDPYDKVDLWQKIADLGGTIAKNVTKKTTLIIIGPWDSVTTKQKRAEELKEKGQDITFWSREDLYQALGLQAADEQPPF
ncbi:exonuclease domain-containing protein [Corynebacterium sp. HS2168-gen11]|uniref:exonuclease domain-containing protein n=1 Tax=Corynebacterium sp. HS2168-gen11 TaxID=2974027 RepID=UPI00216ACFFE|nr:exonuclease domain-containing protein [Corynebacterium sp. HS2168-gen11]MCS4536230.1 exonuclease domain-containing protein [Corynebacterium sp. HS2168-gen11]